MIGMSPIRDLDATAARLFTQFLRRSHLLSPSDIPKLVAEEARVLGGEGCVIHLIDYEQARLVPLAGPDSAGLETVSVEGTVHGRVFATSSILQVPGTEAGRLRLVLPLLDGTDRLGTLELTVEAMQGAAADRRLMLCERYAHLVAQAIVTKAAYGDTFELARRTRPMDVAAELIWRMMPPLVFATDNLVVGGLLEPAYANGGDCLDYAVNGRTAHLAIFDAMGHGLAAAGVSSLAVSGYRSARRRGLGLSDTYVEIDGTLAEQAPDRHVTAVLAQLNLDDGRLHWVNAGHPAPLLLREARVIRSLEAQPLTPLGMRFTPGPVPVSEIGLQPGDMVLLYTDGLPEARLPDGSFFTVERLAEFIERQAAAGYPAPETLRRLRHAVLAHQQGRLQDDASALLVEWRRGTERILLPPTND
jgi:serine phosphatase RsbU (regulator of sigma subunit)